MVEEMRSRISQKEAQIDDLMGLLTDKDMKIDEIDDVRTFKQGSRTLASHRCQEWQRGMNSGMVSLSQKCEDRRDYSNSILVLEDGSISVIRQIVDERYTALTLTKLK